MPAPQHPDPRALTNASGASFAVIGSASPWRPWPSPAPGSAQTTAAFGLTNITPLTLNNAFTNNATGTFGLAPSRR